MNLKNHLLYNTINLGGWKTNRKFLVIESDDWGSIRMPSKETYYKCLKEGYPVNLNPYEKYDSLASKDDLEKLFELVLSFKDKNGNHPVITANCVVGNPDFEKITNDDFKKYHYELISETFKRYPNHEKNLTLWKKGFEAGIFYPQYHAREHLNVSKFMMALQGKDPDVLFGLKNQMPGCIRKGEQRTGNYFVEATHYSSEKDKKEKLEIFLEGLNIFEKTFGYKSESVIPPNYTWNREYDLPTFKKGVKYFQGVRKMRQPNPGKKPLYFKRKTGTINPIGQVDLVRNVIFEPSLVKSTETINNCLSQIFIAYKHKKPAIISSHRINYVGFIDEKNRDNNLKLLEELFKKIKNRWPEIEFVTSVDLGRIIKDSRK